MNYNLVIRLRFLVKLIHHMSNTGLRLFKIDLDSAIKTHSITLRAGFKPGRLGAIGSAPHL